LEIVAPVNEVVALFNAAIDDGDKAQLIRAISMVLSLASAELEDFDWPPEARHAAREVGDAASATSTAAETLLSKLTDDAAATFAAEVDALATASSQMRQALGLRVPASR
jgi:hypothetical protein